MTIIKDFVIKKIELAKKYLGEARELFKLSDLEIINSSSNLHVAERLLQLIVDEIIDINQHLIKELNLETAEDLKGTFDIISDYGILEKEFAGRIGKVVGLRNLIVHQYEKIDNKKFLADFRKHNSDFDEYFKYITAYLNN